MLKNLIANIPEYIKLLVKLYAFNLLLFFCIRLLFYYFNNSSDTDTVSFYEKVTAFKIGVEFDTAVFCWIAYLPALLWTLAYFFKRTKLYTYGFYCFLALQYTFRHRTLTRHTVLCKFH